MLAKNNHTYGLIKSIIDFAKNIFQTDKIHIGMDETFGLGFGAFYKQNGYISPFDIFNEHLKTVNDYALSVGFKEVMIWSDMYFRFLSKTEYYYDPSIVLKDEVINKIPDNVSLVYWDYYNYKDHIVDSMVKNHINTNQKTIFASGTWIWTRLNYDKKQTDRTALMHLEISKKNKLKDFIITQWMDDGAYGDHYSTMLGVYELSLAAYDIKLNKEVFKLITSLDYNDEINKTKINNTTMIQNSILWDDPLLSIYLNNFENSNNLLKKQRKLLKDVKKYEFESLIVKINLLKIESYYKLKSGYSKQKLDKKHLINNYNEIIILIDKLNEWYRNMWYKNYKMVGLEVIQNRLATQSFRAKEMINIIENYKSGDKIDPLDEKIIKNQFLSAKYNDIAFSTKPF